MAISDVISQIDAEILKLQQAKALLSGATITAAAKVAVAAPVKSGRRGRPKGSKNATTVAAKSVEAKSAPKKKRQLSPEGRKAIAEAMKRRWAERRKQAAK